MPEFRDGVCVALLTMITDVVLLPGVSNEQILMIGSICVLVSAGCVRCCRQVPAVQNPFARSRREGVWLWELQGLGRKGPLSAGKLKLFCLGFCSHSCLQVSGVWLCLQGIKAVLAESYERIHRSNLVGMGVIPLEYLPGDTADSLGLTGRERYTVVIPEQLTPRMVVDIKVQTDRVHCCRHVWM